MSIRAVYSSQEEIPDLYRDLYEEKDGAYRLVKIDGIKTDADVSRVMSALEKEKRDHQEAKKKLESILGGKKVDEVQALLDRLPELEVVTSGNGRIDDDKINQAVEARLKTKTAPIERELNQYKALNSELEAKLSELMNKEKQRRVYDSVREASTKLKVLDTAQEDVLLLAEKVFEINDDGSVTTRDGVGITPGLAPEVWLIEMQQRRPHWWPSSVGGGARGSTSGGSLANNPWSRDAWSLTEQGRIVQTLGIDKASQIARSVGVDINNPKKPR